MRDSLSPGISSALACQVPYAVPFDRLLACNRAFRDARASSSPLGGKTALTQATYGFPGAGWPPVCFMYLMLIVSTDALIRALTI